MLHTSGAGELLSNSDLVGWVQLGVQHVPRSEDVPIGEALSASGRLTNLQILYMQAALATPATPAAILPKSGVRKHAA